MKRSRFTEEQIVAALRHVEGEMPVANVCRDLGIAEATFYAWKKRYDRMDVAELRQVRQLETENAKLKRAVNELTMDCNILQEVLRKKI